MTWPLECGMKERALILFQRPHRATAAEAGCAIAVAQLDEKGAVYLTQRASSDCADRMLTKTTSMGGLFKTKYPRRRRSSAQVRLDLAVALTLRLIAGL